MDSIWLHLSLPVLAVSAFVGLASAEDLRMLHDPAAPAGAGLKKDLLVGITEAEFLKLGEQPKTANVTLVAAFNAANSGMNFNGGSHGSAIYTIPVGWTVEVTLINPSPVPHSVVVVEREMVRKVRVGEPVFKGASTPSPVSGVSLSRATFTFTASEAGEYAFACGIPMHAMAGHWVALNVSAEAGAPALKFVDASVKAVK